MSGETLCEGTWAATEHRYRIGIVCHHYAAVYFCWVPPFGHKLNIPAVKTNEFSLSANAFLVFLKTRLPVGHLKRYNFMWFLMVFNLKKLKFCFLIFLISDSQTSFQSNLLNRTKHTFTCRFQTRAMKGEKNNDDQ